jgi:uncharacterized membrane protein YfcA
VITGGLSNVTSGGAGVFTIYFLTAYAGLAIQASTGTVLAASTIIVLVGAISFLRKKQVNTQLALTVGLSGVAAAFFAARYAAVVDSASLEEAFGFFTLALATYTAVRLFAEWRSKSSRVAAEIDLARDTRPDHLPKDAPATLGTQPSRWTGTDPVSIAVQVAKGVFIGLATGLFGVGLASLSIILFMLLFRLDFKMILGTSLFASFMRYLGGAAGYLSSGLVNPYYFIILVVGGAVGSIVGARMILEEGRGSRDVYVKLIIILVLLFVSYEFLFKKAGL